jgi:hypothetical protein
MQHLNMKHIQTAVRRATMQAAVARANYMVIAYLDGVLLAYGETGECTSH